MTNKNNISSLYGLPNLGCLIGTAYQHELSQLSVALADAGLDLTTTEYLVLRALYTCDGIQQCEISDMICKDKAAVCRCVTAMVAKGLVTTEAVSHKCLKVYLSAEGHRIESAVMDVGRQRQEALAAAVSNDEMEVFVSVLKKIIHQ